MVKKWQTMIEARVDVKTSDAYTLRVSCVGFTKKRQNQIKKTSYAQTQQVKVSFGVKSRHEQLID